PCLLVGLFIFVLGCLGCYFSDSINLLLVSRFVQAFGGSTGSVLGQAIARDVFRGVQRGKVYSTIGGALSFSPALGPFVGGVVDQAFGWPSIFLLLMIAGTLVFLSVILKLPETHLNRATRHSLKEMAWNLLKDRRVLGFAILVAAANGILFSYYAEGSFYLIDMLGLSPSMYGLTFVGIALASFSGAWLSRTLHNHLTSEAILWRGILVQLGGAGFFVIATVMGGIFNISSLFSIVITVGSMTIIAVGSSMVIPNCLSLALEAYQHAVGTASSLFGFFYYALISLFTLVMGFLHNGTLYPMPIYFFGIIFLTLGVFLKMIDKEKNK
ncbi:MAG TPA: multidrug effflux MFS transporter, partial [Alphaproteobacteria bacterium]|nr:multidrug effflux MFS transporter [Alphaproteobacteria bacterium]